MKRSNQRDPTSITAVSTPNATASAKPASVVISVYAAWPAYQAHSDASSSATWPGSGSMMARTWNSRAAASHSSRKTSTDASPAMRRPAPFNSLIIGWPPDPARPRLIDQAHALEHATDVPHVPGCFAQRQPWPGQVDLHGFQDAARTRREHHDHVAQEHRLGDAVRDEQHRVAGFHPDPLQLHVHLVARQRVQRAEGSSISSSLGSSTRARQIATRWRMPPDSSRG